MSKLKLKNGTPVGNEHLCRSCSHAHYLTGYRESEVLVICNFLDPAMVVPFPVHECTNYWDRNRPSWEAMQKLAIDFGEARRKPTPGFRTTGFSLVSAAVEDDDDEADEAARRKVVVIREP